MGHFLGKLNTEADGPSRLPVFEKIPPASKQELYAISALDRYNNNNFPLDMQMVKAAQDKDQLLKKLKEEDKYTGLFGVEVFDAIEVTTIAGKKWVPTTLQPRLASLISITPTCDIRV